MGKQADIVLRYASKYCCELILLISLLTSFYHTSQNKDNEGLIRSDGVGYYSYLPAVFIYNDFHYTFIDEVHKAHPEIMISTEFLSKTDQGDINKYFIGEAILLTPFFLTAHFLSLLFGLPADGFSLLYQLAVLIAANIFLWIGCHYTRKLLLELSFEASAVAFVLGLTFLGSNLFFYSTVEYSYSHIYSYGIIAAFLFYACLFFRYQLVKHLYLAIFLFAMVILLRPTNGFIALMVPFFAETPKRFVEVIKTITIKSWSMLAVIFGSMIFLQLFIYYLQTGHFMVWSYGTERFYFGDPEFFEVLCGLGKGLFVYAPLTLLSVGGLFSIYKQNKFQLLSIVLFLFMFTYVSASWWCWWYGGSLGQREFIDIYCVVTLLLAFLYRSIRTKIWKRILHGSAMLFISWSLILTYQYRHQIIDCYGMNYNKFWFTFLKTSEDVEGLVYADKLFEKGQPTNIVWIKSQGNNKYLSSDKNPESSICVCRDKARLWETFNMIPREGNKVAIRSDDGSYLTVLADQHNKISHRAQEISPQEEFEQVRINDKEVVFKAVNNKYLQMNQEQLFAGAENIDKAEKFMVLNK